MKHRLNIVAQKFDDLFATLNLRTRNFFSLIKRRIRFCLSEPSHYFHSLHERLQIFLFTEIVGIDSRMLRWVWGAKGQMTSALHGHQYRGCTKTRALDCWREIAWAADNLNVWLEKIWLRLHESDVFRKAPKLRERWFRLVVRQDAWMVLNVPANAREISHDMNFKRLENIGWPDTREHEQLW